MSALRFSLVETFDAFGAIEDAWRDLESRTLPAGVYAAFDWIAMSWPQSGASSAAALVWEGERLVLGLPLSRTRQPDGWSHYGGLGGEMIQLADILIDRDVDADAAIGQLLTGLRTAGRGSVLQLFGIPVDTPLGRVVPMREADVTGRPAQIELEGGFDSYFAGLSARSRSRHRRMLRRLGGEVRVATASSWEDDLDWFLSTKRSWTPPSGEALRTWVTSPVARTGLLKLGRQWADDGRAVLTLVDASDGRRAAACLCFCLDTQAVFYATTYDPAFANYSPGVVLLVETARLLAERGITRLDLMQFPAAYKDRLKTSTRVLRQVTIDLSVYSPDGSPWITVPVAATGVMGDGTGRTGGTPSSSLRPAMMRRRSASLLALWRRMLRSITKLE